MTKIKFNGVLFPLISFFSLIFFWQIASFYFMDFFLPSPLSVFQRFLASAGKGFFFDVFASILRISIGFLVSLIVSVPLGFLIYSNEKSRLFLQPLIEFARYTPLPAFIPLLILWFGIGEEEKIIVVFLTVSVNLILMVSDACKDVPKNLLDFAFTLGLDGKKALMHVVFPFALPRIVEASRISLGYAWSALIIAELIGASTGLGFLIIKGQRLLQTDLVFAAIIFTGLIGLISDFLMKKLEKKVSHWKK